MAISRATGSDHDQPVNPLEVLVGARPLRPVDVLGRHDLRSRVEALGTSPPRWVNEGSVRFGRPIVYQLAVDEFPGLRQRPDVAGRAFVLVEFPFDLEEPPTGNRYLRADLTITVQTPDVVARSLWPSQVNSVADARQAARFIITDHLALTDASDLNASPRTGRVFRYADLRPIITSYGGGQTRFHWTFEPYGQDPVVPAGRTVFAILDLPIDTRSVDGLLEADVTVSRRVLGVWGSIRVTTDQLPFVLAVRPPHAERADGRYQNAQEPSAQPSPHQVASQIFISYAHDSSEHVEHVRALAEFLARRGVNVVLDLWAHHRLDWSAWIRNKLISVDYVVVIASAGYRLAGDGAGPPNEYRGVQSETALLRDLLYHDRATWVPKLLPVILPGHDIDELPDFLQPHTATHYRVRDFTNTGAESLLRALTGQPAFVAPPLGGVPYLPPKPYAQP